MNKNGGIRLLFATKRILGYKLSLGEICLNIEFTNVILIRFCDWDVIKYTWKFEVELWNWLLTSNNMWMANRSSKIQINSINWRFERRLQFWSCYFDSCNFCKVINKQWRITESYGIEKKVEELNWHE